MKLKNIIFGIFVVLSCAPLFSQEKLTTANVDSLTYAQYLKGDWQNLIESGNKALDQGIDFYYLRMRIGYAYYMQQNYRKAIPHYQYALNENPKDPYSLSYLLYSYQFSGRKYDALALSNKIDSIKNPELFKKFAPGIKSFGFFFNYNIADAGSTRQKISNSIKTDTDGIRKTTNNYSISSVYLSHSLGRRISINHNISYLKKNEHNFSVLDGQVYESTNQDLNQWDYNLQLQINLAKGITLTPVYNYVSIKIPLEDVGLDDFTDSYAMYGATLNSDFGNFNLGASYVLGEINRKNQSQLGVHASYYPFGNLNLYYILHAYFKNQEYGNNSESDFIHQHTLGFKVNNYWWAELSAIFPDFNNFYNPMSGGMWNGLEGAKNVMNIKNIFFIKNTKLSLILNTGLYQSVSEFEPIDTPLNRSHSFTYSNINITGGLLWNF